MRRTSFFGRIQCSFCTVKEKIEVNITVFCGALDGGDPEFTKRAYELGAWMADNGHSLVYGAGNAGMMGAVSDGVTDRGGTTIGVTPEFFVMAEVTRDDLTELIIPGDMSERRKVMIEMGDAFIALPGGMGTLDEISEVITYKRLSLLGRINKPIMMYNVNGFYDNFFRMLDDMTEQGFCRRVDRDNVTEVRCIKDIENALAEAGKADTTVNILDER